MKILALDLATNTGWALGSIEAGVIEHGVYKLPKTGDDIGEYLVHFRDWLEQMLHQKQPDEIIYESAVFYDRRKTTPITVRKLVSLGGMTEAVVFEAGLKCMEENVQTITTHFLGKGPGVPRYGDARKEATVKKCRDRGWLPKNDNDADALALLDLALSLKDPARAVAATPLFGGA